LDQVSDEDDKEADKAAGESTAGPTSNENQEENLMMNKFEMLHHEDEEEDDAGVDSDTFKTLYQRNRIPGTLMTDEDVKKFEMEQSLLTHEDI
jgi:hypothetical protein